VHSRRREWQIRALLLIGAPLLLFGATELFLRMAGFAYPPGFWIAVEAKPMMMTNDRFGVRFFPAALARTPDAELLYTKKPSNTRRIFVLGESAAMGFPEPAFGLARMLEAILERRYPDIRWEVMNAAMTAINSHAILPVARDCARLEPDAFVILAGNNEAVGPYGPATVFGRAGLSLPIVRMSVWQTSTRIGQVAAEVMRGRTSSQREWRGMEMFADQRLAHNDPRLDAMYRIFETNLRDIAETGVKARARVFLATVPVNLKDCPPFASLEPDNAQSEFERAENYRRARDLDALRFRADSRINDLIRKVAQETNGSLIDAEKEFGLAGEELFYEHVHLTPEGNYRLASLFADRIVGAGAAPTPRLDEVRRMLALTRSDESRMRRQIAALMERPPFTGQADHDRRLARFKSMIEYGPLVSDAMPIYDAAIRNRPNDIHLRARYAELLRESGKPAEAAAEWAALNQLAPGRKIWQTSHGAALSDAGRQEEAKAAYRRALDIDAHFDLAHFGLAAANARQQNFHEAERDYRAALDINPDYAEARVALAQLLARSGKSQPAIEQYRKAVQSRPDMPEAHYDLGVLLAQSNQLEAAIQHYQEAIRLRPAYPEALNNLGTSLAKKGDYASAARAFERAVELKPSFEAARANLQRLRRLNASRN
jgi:tetratricopeptide (TPR) repeat protein